MTLEEYSQGAEKSLEEVKPFVKELGDWYAENPEGVFLLGKDVSYADVMVLGWLKMMDLLGVSERFWGMEGGERLKKVYEAGGKWLERDSY